MSPMAVCIWSLLEEKLIGEGHSDLSVTDASDEIIATLQQQMMLEIYQL